MKQIKITYSEQDQALLDSIDVMLDYYRHSYEDVSVPCIIRSATFGGIKVSAGEKLSPVYDELVALRAEVFSKMIPVKVMVL